jgi:hypothetical protein
MADEPAPLRPPGVPQRGPELARYERGDPVLEPFAPAVRERKVVGIGADAEATLGGGRRRVCERRREEQDEEREADTGVQAGLLERSIQHRDPEAAGR